MAINFSSSVLMVKNLEEMKIFYRDVLEQEIEVDFGGCIGFKCGIALWELNEEMPITAKLGRKFSENGNQNLEICFETESFDEVLKKIAEYSPKYLHREQEEPWGQRTIRFYDPEGNLVEIGESVPCFVRRFFASGMNLEEVAKRTSVPIEIVKKICS